MPELAHSGIFISQNYYKEGKMKNRVKEIKFLLETVLEYSCFTAEEFEQMQVAPERTAILFKEIWLINSSKGPLVLFNPFLSLSDAQSLLVHIFFNRPMLNNEKPLFTREQFANKILEKDKNQFTREEAISLLFTVSTITITEAIIELLKGK